MTRKNKNPKGRNLLKRLTRYYDVWMDFIFEPNGPFTNNQAGQDLRHLKIEPKVATNYQTFKRAQHYARVQSFCSTLRKHSMDIFHNFIKILDGKQVVYQVS